MGIFSALTITPATARTLLLATIPCSKHRTTVHRCAQTLEMKAD
jgi:hypothetical protein